MRLFSNLVPLLLALIVLSPSMSRAQAIVSEHADARDDATLIQAIEQRQDAVAMAVRAWRLWSGVGEPADPKAAVALWERAAGNRNRRAMARLGMACSIGRGLPRHPEHALGWWHQSAESGDRLGMLMFARGLDAIGGHAEAQFWRKLAAEQGSLAAALELADRLNDDDSEAARRWVNTVIERTGEKPELAPSSIDGETLYELGEMHRKGRIVPLDAKLALGWYRRAESVRHAGAMRRLGEACESGAGCPIDQAEAEMWYQRAADLGDPPALLRLGQIYENAIGVNQDMDRATMYYRRAAAAGEAAAKTWLRSHGLEVLPAL